MLWIKLFPCLGYFPALGEIPAPLVDPVRQALDLAAEVIPGYDHDRTLYRHHQMVREYYQILSYGKEARRVILRTLLRAVRTMDNPADMINAALESDIRKARELHYKLLPLMNANFIESNPIPVKAVLAMMGMIEENYRLPLVRIGTANREKLSKIAEELGLLQTVGKA